MERLSGALAAAALIAVLVSPAGAAYAERAQAPGCDVQSATLDWGFKDSFRAYIDGSIANGEWTVSDGAVYETPRFGWRDGTGRVDPSLPGGAVSFAGGVRFTGHDGVLDTLIANPVIRFDAQGRAAVLLDVTGATMEGEQVDLTAVEFVEIDLSAADLAPVDGVIAVEDAPTTLTAEGASAFPNYEAGAAFDPIAFTILVPGCRLAPPPPAMDAGWIVVVVLAVVVLAGTVLTVTLGIRRRVR